MKKSLHILVILFLSGNLFGQIIITDGGSDPSVASDCIAVFQSQTVDIVSSMTCVDPLDILYDKTGPISGLGSNIASFSGTYSLKFDSIGIYSIFCGSKDIADQCFHVLDPVATPTMGQWGLIILALLLLILGVVAQKTTSHQ